MDPLPVSPRQGCYFVRRKSHSMPETKFLSSAGQGWPELVAWSRLADWLSAGPEPWKVFALALLRQRRTLLLPRRKSFYAQLMPLLIVVFWTLSSAKKN